MAQTLTIPSTSGNFGMPTAPLEIPLGRISSFNIYHLMMVESPTKAFSFSLHTSKGLGTRGDPVDKTVGPGAVKSTEGGKARASGDATRPSRGGPEPFTFAPDQLGALASIIRAKNSGPFEVTFDVIFSKRSVYNRVRDSNILKRSKIASLYGLEEADVVTAMWWPQALAFKATVVRSAVSGGWGEVDMHSSTQHVRLMYLEIPKIATTRSVQRVGGMMRSMLWVGMPRAGLSSFLAVFTIIAILSRYWGLGWRVFKRRTQSAAS